MTLGVMLQIEASLTNDYIIYTHLWCS